MTTLAYESNFVSSAERERLLSFALANRDRMLTNGLGKGRFYLEIEDCVDNDLALIIKNRIKDKYGINSHNSRKQHLGHLLSFIEDGGFVHTHIDVVSNPNSEQHHRFNLIIQRPLKGGAPMYNGKSVNWEEGMLLCYRPDLNMHSCSPVYGDSPRIVLSYGWILND